MARTALHYLGDSGLAARTEPVREPHQLRMELASLARDNSPFMYAINDVLFSINEGRVAVRPMLKVQVRPEEVLPAHGLDYFKLKWYKELEEMSSPDFLSGRLGDPIYVNLAMFTKDTGIYKLSNGHHRTQLSIDYGLESIPCVLRYRDLLISGTFVSATREQLSDIMPAGMILTPHQINPQKVHLWSAGEHSVIPLAGMPDFFTGMRFMEVNDALFDLILLRGAEAVFS